MTSFISIYTLNKFNKILLDYKKNIIKDLYIHYIDNTKINYQELENKLLENNVKKYIYNININKCLAIICKDKTYIQCNNGQTNNKYCLKHINNRNYGSYNLN